MVRILFLLLLWLTVSNKEILHQWPGALFTQTDPPHVRGHLLVLDCQVLGVEKLVHLHPSPHAILLPPTTSSTTLNKCSRLIVGSQENDYINLGQINAKQHLVAAKVEGYLCSPLLQHLLSWWQKAGVIHHKWGITAVPELVESEVHEVAVNSSKDSVSSAEDDGVLRFNSSLQILDVLAKVDPVKQVEEARVPVPILLDSSL